jgi:hypothetical protein
MQPLLVDLLKDIFLTLLLGENNKPRLGSTIEKYQSTLIGCFFFYMLFLLYALSHPFFGFFLNKLSF